MEDESFQPRPRLPASVFSIAAGKVRLLSGQGMQPSQVTSGRRLRVERAWEPNDWTSRSSTADSKDECLFTVLVSVGDRDTAQELVDEAFARAWASWRTVSRHPAPAAWVVRTALNANISRWRRRRREVSVPDLGTVADLPAVDGDRQLRRSADHGGPDAASCPATAGCRAAAVPRPGHRPIPRRCSASRRARSRPIWAAPLPRCAATLCPNYSRRTHHERR